MKKLIVPLASFLLTVTAASAYPLYEPFNYDPAVNTNLIGQTNPDGLTWTQAGSNNGLTNQPNITNGSLTYPGLAPSIGNSVQFGGLGGTNGLAARFPLPSLFTSGTLYFSFLTKITDITALSTSGIFWAAFNNSSGSQLSVPTAVATRVVTKTNAAGGFLMGLDKSAGSPASFVFATNVFSLGDTILVVGSYTFNTGGGSDDVSQMWINPDSSSFGAAIPPTDNMLSSTAGGDLASAQIGSFCLFERSAAQPHGIVVDELIISTNWADVTPTHPVITTQPQSQRVLAGGSATFNVGAFKVAGYQWRFNGTPISGANSSTLTVANIQSGNTGSYTVVATNGATSITSGIASLIVVPDTFPRLRPLWNIPPNTPNYPYVTADNSNIPNLRSIAFNSLSNQVLVASRTNYITGDTNPMIYVLDGSTGTNLYNLDTTTNNPLSGGQLSLTCIDVSDDGSVYACNEANTAATTFNIYRWASSANGSSPVGPPVFHGAPNGTDNTPRWGDDMRVMGSGINTVIIADSNDGNWFASFTPTDSTLLSFINNPNTATLATGSIGRGLQFGDTNSFYVKRKGGPLQLAAYVNGSPFQTTVITNFSNFPAGVGPVAFPLGSNMLCGIEFGTSSSVPDTLDLFEVSDMSLPLLLAKYNFPTNHQGNANFIGQVRFAGTNVYALDANNGILAMTWVPFRPTLNITTVGSNVQISWPTNATGYTLFSSPAVAPTTWTSVGTGTISGGNYVVTSPISAAPKFYRLQQ